MSQSERLHNQGNEGLNLRNNKKTLLKQSVLPVLGTGIILFLGGGFGIALREKELSYTCETIMHHGREIPICNAVVVPYERSTRDNIASGTLISGGILSMTGLAGAVVLLASEEDKK